MEDLTIKQVRELMATIDTTRPAPNGRNDYMEWHGWRNQAVRYAKYEYGIKLTEWGYDVVVSNDMSLHFLFAEKNGIVGYIEYDELTHSFRDIQRYDVSRDKDMHIIADKEESEKHLSRPYRTYKTLKDVDPYNNRNMTHIIKG